MCHDLHDRHAPCPQQASFVDQALMEFLVGSVEQEMVLLVFVVAVAPVVAAFSCYSVLMKAVLFVVVCVVVLGPILVVA